jgi:hypothetical protein
MKTIKIAFLSVLAVLFFSCNGQNAKDHKQSKTNSEQMLRGSFDSTDTLNKPKVKVNVNKRYDDKGRVVQFDSTYSYFYSSPNGIRHLNNDSIYDQFQSFFNKSYPHFFEHQNNDIFFNDSLFKYDFFNNDYFLKRYQLNQKNFEGFYKQMDSLKQNFMKQRYPNGYPKKDKSL